MPKLSPIKTTKFENFLVSVGCTVRSTCGQNGSHKFYWRDDLKRPITVITSDPEIPDGHIKQALKVLNITQDEYLDLIKKRSLNKKTLNHPNFYLAEHQNIPPRFIQPQIGRLYNKIFPHFQGGRVYNCLKTELLIFLKSFSFFIPTV